MVEYKRKTDITLGLILIWIIFWVYWKNWKGIINKYVKKCKIKFTWKFLSKILRYSVNVTGRKVSNIKVLSIALCRTFQVAVYKAVRWQVLFVILTPSCNISKLEYSYKCFSTHRGQPLVIHFPLLCVCHSFFKSIPNLTFKFYSLPLTSSADWII